MAVFSEVILTYETSLMVLIYFDPRSITYGTGGNLFDKEALAATNPNMSLMECFSILD
jgi:hypothetical protein